MATLLYYLSLPFIYGISLLPFRLLYFCSDILYLLVYHIAGYRKEVVMENLQGAFPEKSDTELKKIRKDFYRYFCDLILESVKTLTISPKSLKKHIQFNDQVLFGSYLVKKQSLVVMMGHFGNWELAGARFAIEPLHTLALIYHPLHNKHFNDLFIKMRTRLGNKLYPMDDVLRCMIKNRDKCTITAFVADQTPSSQNCYWTHFMNRETLVFEGADKLARRFKYPVIYTSMNRIKRGLYELKSEVLIEDPASMPEHGITELYLKRLEKDIRNHPATWLWSHRRWKHKREK